MYNILWISDGVTPTGFSRVAHSIIKYLPRDKYNIEMLAINYHGDPHEYNYNIYPAGSKGILYGFNRIQDLAKDDIDLIFILNDVWIINEYLKVIKEVWSKINKKPEIVVYFPVDAEEHDPDWYVNFDIVSKAVVYTEFGKNVVKKACPNLETIIIPHGVDLDDFYKINKPTKELKETLFPKDRTDLIDSFIVLNAGRNQPRKKLDIALEGFSIFAKNKPENVKFYSHCGIVDSYIDISKIAKRFNIGNRLIISNASSGVQTVPVQKLNLIYNCCEVGINTSIGEGWSLCNAEHAATGAPQIVPAHSACKELFSDCGILLPVVSKIMQIDIMTVGGLVRAEDVANSLELLYSNKELYNKKKNACLEKFTSDKYLWKNISKQWDNLFTEVLKWT
jgi:glycosyltransferase involved in cell wall biosynthesis